jgi:hypothetical protein
MTKEQRTAADSLRAHAPGYRVISDLEGWPVIPGRLGQIEYHDGVRLAAFTDRPRLHRRLLAIPRLEAHQKGDQELRVIFPASALGAVAKTLGARRKRVLAPSQLEALARARAISQFRAATA